MASVDDAETNKRFAESENANFPFLSDPSMKVADAYGVLRPVNPANPTARRNAARWTFYIGPNQKILFIDTNSGGQTANAGKTLAAKLEELGVKKKKK